MGWDKEFKADIKTLSFTIVWTPPPLHRHPPPHPLTFPSLSLLKRRTVDDGLIMDRDLKLLRESCSKSGLPCADLQAPITQYTNRRNHVWGGACDGLWRGQRTS